MKNRELDTLSTKQILIYLDTIKHKYTPGDSKNKIKALEILKNREIMQASLLVRFHKMLCFLQAYPDSQKVLVLVEDILQGFEERIGHARQNTSSSNIDQLDNTGIVGTYINYPFSYPTAVWLFNNFASDITIDWELFENEEVLSSFLPIFVANFENDALDAEDFDIEKWFSLGLKNKTNFSPVMELLTRSQVDFRLKDIMYEISNLQLSWKLHKKNTSLTLSKIPVRKIHYQTKPLDLRKDQLIQIMKKPLRSVQHVSPSEGLEFIDLSNTALCVRLREIHSLLYANKEDVLITKLERGIQIILIGILPRYRLPLETTYCFFVLKNGVPIGYGCSSVLLDRTEIATNVFPSFRHGESAYIYAQILRVFYQIFKVGSFLVEKTQIGNDESEAIKSGAFWFYSKVGFYPIDPGVLKLAKEETNKIKNKKGYRTPAKILRQLAKSDMCLNLTGTEPVASQIKTENIGKLVTKLIFEKYNGNRKAAIISSVNKLKNILPIGAKQQYTQNEWEAIKQYSLLIIQIPDLAFWPRLDKRDLVRVMRSKGTQSEIEHAINLLEHRRLINALCKFSKKDYYKSG